MNDDGRTAGYARWLRLDRWEVIREILMQGFQVGGWSFNLSRGSASAPQHVKQRMSNNDRRSPTRNGFKRGEEDGESKEEKGEEGCEGEETG